MGAEPSTRSTLHSSKVDTRDAAYGRAESPSGVLSEPFERWISALETRHLAELTTPEISRALRALSSAYVERRQRISRGEALSGAGKRAAFALFYGPLHYMIVRHIALELTRTTATGASLIIDLGCGTGAASAAWASVLRNPPAILAVDRHPWALEEAARTFRAFGLKARTRLADITTFALPDARAAMLAAFALNELPDPGRDALLARLLGRAERGDQLLIVEPLARRVAPWWDKWAGVVLKSGGRDDEWRFRAALPPIVARLDRAAGLRHDELTARSLSLNL